MLYRLEVENFLSVRDKQVLDLTIAPNVPDPDTRYAPIFKGSKLRAPKVIALYGKNASGKTNFLRALEFVLTLVRIQKISPGWPVPVYRFNDELSASRPIRLAIEFGGAMNLSPGVIERYHAGDAVEWGIYRYELVIEVTDGLPTRILEENLRQRPNGQGKWQRVFERDADGNIKDSPSFSVTGFRHLQNTLGPTVSVLASFALFQHPVAQVFVKAANTYFFQGVTALSDDHRHIIDYMTATPEIVTALERELSRIDVGVESVCMRDSAQGKQPMFKHSGLQHEMPLHMQSNGTQRFIKIFPIIHAALNNGGGAIIDELDITIHAAIIPDLMRWFYNPARNPHDAQLWFTCHAASALDDLNKEEVVICDKDHMGRTTVHSLMDVKVRRGENLYRKYLSGALGGIPQIG